MSKDPQTDGPMDPRTHDALCLIIELFEQISGPEDEWSLFDDLLFKLCEKLRTYESPNND